MERFDQELAYYNLSLAELQGEGGAGLCKEETCGIPCSHASTVSRDQCACTATSCTSDCPVQPPTWPHHCPCHGQELLYSGLSLVWAAAPRPAATAAPQQPRRLPTFPSGAFGASTGGS